jgi:flagellar protein FlbD
MIELTRINGKAMVINADLIVSVEATPDTVITLTSGAKIMVKESVRDIVDRTLVYRKRCLQEPVDAWISQVS